MNENILLKIYSDIRTVFRLNDIALMTGETNFMSLNKKLHYYVRTGKLQNPRKGIYSKPDFNWEELACKIYTPSYISLEYVLQKEGIIFQYSSGITTISYLTRTIRVSERDMIYRKIKGDVLVYPQGVKKRENNVNIASAERAFLDLLYLNKTFYFDNLNPLKKTLVFQLLPHYKSKSLTTQIKQLLK